MFFQYIYLQTLLTITINKTKDNNYHTQSEQFENPIKKIVERGKFDTHSTQMHDCSLTWLGRDTSNTNWQG